MSEFEAIILLECETSKIDKKYLKIFDEKVLVDLSFQKGSFESDDQVISEPLKRQKQSKCGILTNPNCYGVKSILNLGGECLTLYLPCTYASPRRNSGRSEVFYMVL